MNACVHDGARRAEDAVSEALSEERVLLGGRRNPTHYTR